MGKIVDYQLARPPCRVLDDADLARRRLLDVARSLIALEMRDGQRRWKNAVDPVLLERFDAAVKAGRDYTQVEADVAEVVRNNAPRF